MNEPDKDELNPRQKKAFFAILFAVCVVVIVASVVLSNKHLLG